MSNGSRLFAVVVVVVLAAVGLYFAFLYNPDQVPPEEPVVPRETLPDGTITPPAPPSGGLGETPSGQAGQEALQPVKAPPSGAFAPPTGAAGQTPGTGPTNPGGSGSAPVTGGGTSPASGGGANSPNSPNPVGGSTQTPPARPAGSAGTEYTIQSGDTLEGLARRFLGDGAKWRSIVEANPGLNPSNLQIGKKIVIPGASAASGNASGNGGNAPAAGGNTYTVVKGDTLIGIARKVYGSEADWKRILEANSGLLKGDASSLQPGMKLVIPAKRS